ncbi:MAG: peptidylprolyl isomerase, partial [Cyanobacteria bacterium J06636_16]
MTGVIASPVVTDDLSNIVVATNADDTTRNLFDHFDDPFTTGTVARFELTDASLNGAATEVLLFDQPGAGAPLTVQNFLNYVNDGDYTNTIIHRSVSEPSLSIIQGGGFTIDGLGTNPDALRVIQPDSPVPNEFSPDRSNLRGTIAMAKQETDPNSATNQWFFNLADNSANLDTQNGGFTVFGEVLSDSDLATIDAICAVPVFNASSLFGTAALEEIPLLFPDDSITITGDDNFVRYSSITVTQRAELTFTVSGNSNPQLVNASVSNNQLILDYLPGQVGTADITVRATNLLGEVIEDTFAITVSDSDLSGTNEDDEIIGSAGNDNLIGRPGNDTLVGGAGNDTLSSGRGDDSLDGGEGNDTLFGRFDNDMLSGGSGDDSLDGGEGNDTLFGEFGNDTLDGGEGDDTLGGGPGDDQLQGSAGDDQMRGGRGIDVLNGGAGTDVLDGADDDDSLFGGEGDDTLEGGNGNDTLFGEFGNDSLDGGDGDDVLGGGPGNDQLRGAAGDDQMRGGKGNDILT